MYMAGRATPIPVDLLDIALIIHCCSAVAEGGEQAPALPSGAGMVSHRSVLDEPVSR